MAIPQGTIKEVDFDSKELGETITLLIYTPAIFSPLYKYSLLIASDGKDYFQMGRLARFADELLDGNEIENLIIVGVPYKNVEDRRSKYHPNGNQQKAYSRFLANELVPYLENEYPTSCMGKNRTLMGDSLAATASLMAAIRYPNIFGRVILQSPYVNEDILAAVASHPCPELLDVYHVVGKGETFVEISDIKDFLTPNRQLQNLFKERGISSVYQELDGGHSWKTWQPNVRAALEAMFS